MTSEIKLREPFTTTFVSCTKENLSLVPEDYQRVVRNAQVIESMMCEMVYYKEEMVGILIYNCVVECVTSNRYVIQINCMKAFGTEGKKHPILVIQEMVKKVRAYAGTMDIDDIKVDLSCENEEEEEELRRHLFWMHFSPLDDPSPREEPTLPAPHPLHRDARARISPDVSRQATPPLEPQTVAQPPPHTPSTSDRTDTVVPPMD